MTRSYLPLVLLGITGPAWATPFELEVDFTGAPVHSFITNPLFDTTSIADQWLVVGVPRPPAGTSSFDVSWTLPARYRVQAPAVSGDVFYSVRCEWGSSSVTAGSQFVDLDGSHVQFDPEVLPISSSALTVTGSGGDRLQLAVDGLVGGGEDLRSARIVVPPGDLTPTPAQAGTGACSILVSLFAPDPVPDQTLVVPVRPLEDAVDDLAANAAAAYAARFPPASTPGAATMEAELRAMMDALTANGCLLDDDVQNAVAGAYDTSLITGMDDDGAVTGTNYIGSRRFGAVLGDGTRAGQAAGLFSAQTVGRRVFAETDDGGFVAGRWKRTLGSRGVFYAVSGVCTDAGDASTALAGWFDGTLP